MPGPQIKNWPLYHKKRREGLTKTQAAKVANANPRKKKRRRSRRNR